MIDWKKAQRDQVTNRALWISSEAGVFRIPNRGYKNDSNFHGIFIAEIPFQMIQRYTKVGDRVRNQLGALLERIYS